MTLLKAHFQKEFSGGPAISAAFEQSVDDYSVTVLFGPSGCGKTTILRCLAGLERPDSGSISFRDQVWFDAANGRNCSPQLRGVGYLFQEHALFPHLTVAQNIAFGLRKQPADQLRRQVAEILTAFELQSLENRLPRQISGGQQQRTALARVLIRKPRLLLLDEPLSALDSLLREQLRNELRRRLAEFRIPAVIVTHDRTEAIALADQVVVMDRGQVLQAGPVAEVFSKPVNLRVAQLVGVDNVTRVKVLDIEDGLPRIQIGAQTLLAVGTAQPGTIASACIRAEDVVLQRIPGASNSARNQLPAHVLTLTSEGPLVRVEVDCGFPLQILVTKAAVNDLELTVGTRVFVLLKASAIHLV